MLGGIPTLRRASADLSADPASDLEYESEYEDAELFSDREDDMESDDDDRPQYTVVRDIGIQEESEDETESSSAPEESDHEEEFITDPTTTSHSFPDLTASFTVNQIPAGGWDGQGKPLSSNNPASPPVFSSIEMERIALAEAERMADARRRWQLKGVGFSSAGASVYTSSPPSTSVPPSPTTTGLGLGLPEPGATSSYLGGTPSLSRRMPSEASSASSVSTARPRAASVASAAFPLRPGLDRQTSSPEGPTMARRATLGTDSENPAAEGDGILNMPVDPRRVRAHRLDP